jgi:hypothetical protein
MAEFLTDLLAELIPWLYPGPESRRGDATLSVLLGFVLSGLVLALAPVVAGPLGEDKPVWAVNALLGVLLFSWSLVAYNVWVLVSQPAARRLASIAILVNSIAGSLLFVLKPLHLI